MLIPTVELSPEDEIRCFDPEKYKDATGELFHSSILPDKHTDTDGICLDYREPDFYIHPKSRLDDYLCWIYSRPLLDSEKDWIRFLWTGVFGTMQKNQQNSRYEGDL